jgi:hypothetical protein
VAWYGVITYGHAMVAAAMASTDSSDQPNYDNCKIGALFAKYLPYFKQNVQVTSNRIASICSRMITFVGFG